MKKKILLLTLVSAIALSLASCGKKNEEHKSQITGDGADSQSTATASTNPPESTLDPQKEFEENIAKAKENLGTATIAPAATPKPEDEDKRQQKLNNSDASTNITIETENGPQTVNLSFSMSNATGIDFIKLLLLPVNYNISALFSHENTNEQQNNIDKMDLLHGQQFTNNQTLSFNLDPASVDSTNLKTTMFNIVAIDGVGKGYVFQNLDIASTSQITLQMYDGVPIAVAK